jgi:micrococcal nuclease
VAREQPNRGAVEPGPEHGEPAVVVRVVDGDTIWVLRKGEETKVRLIGIDAPEEAHFGDPRECFARRATEFLRQLLEAQGVELELDVEERDQYGRLLAYVWHRDGMVNEVLVAQGYATVATFPPNVRYVGRFLTAERRARAERRGLWGSC